MEKQKFNITYNLGVKIILVCFIAILSYLFIANISSNPFDSIKVMRENTVTNYELLAMEKTELGTMIYSVGQVNNGKDYMYFVDMVKKSIFGYKWVGGGGHINRDLRNDKDFVLSTQLLNEEQNIKPTIFGIFSDQNISKITVSTNGNKSHEAIISKGKGTNERFYVVSFDEDVSGNTSFIFTVAYKNGNKARYLISGEEDISKFQKGIQKYYY